MSTSFPTEAETVFPLMGVSVGGARRFVADALRAREVESEVIETACLLVSELVTNAVVHAPSRVGVRVVVDASGVRVEVADASPSPVRPRPMDPDAVRGRGLQIVGALASAWGTETVLDGKKVWFELRPAVTAGRRHHAG